MLTGNVFYSPESMMFLHRVDTGCVVKAASQWLQLCISFYTGSVQPRYCVITHVLAKTEANRLEAWRDALGHG